MGSVSSRNTIAYVTSQNMGCCFGTQGASVTSDGDSHPEEKANVNSNNSKQAQPDGKGHNTIHPTHGNNDHYKKYGRISSSKVRPKTAPNSNMYAANKKKYKTLKDMEKVYRSKPACLNIVERHPAGEYIQSRPTTSKSIQNAPISSEDGRPKTAASRSTALTTLQTTEIKGESTIQEEVCNSGSPSPDVVKGKGKSSVSPLPEARPNTTIMTVRHSTNRCCTASSISRTGRSQVNLSHIQLRPTDDVPWHYDKYTPVIDHMRQNESSSNWRDEELRRRYKRWRPPGSALAKRRENMIDRMKKQCITLDRPKSRPVTREKSARPAQTESLFVRENTENKTKLEDGTI